MSRKSGDVGLDQLLKEVEQEIDARERAQITQPNAGQPTRKPREQPHSATTLSLGTLLLAVVTANNSTLLKLVHQ